MMYSYETRTLASLRRTALRALKAGDGNRYQWALLEYDTFLAECERVYGKDIARLIESMALSLTADGATRTQGR